MPVNFDDYLSAKKETTGKTWDNKQNYRAVDNSMGELLSEIIKARFKDYYNSNNVKVTKEEPDQYGVLADYAPLGHTIRAGKINDNHVTYDDGTYKGYDTPKVIENLANILHEIYHSRSAAGEHQSKHLGKDWQNMLKEAQEAGFPSVERGFFGGDKLEEFLATAVVLRDMQNRGITPTGRYAPLARKLSEMRTKYPWMDQWLDVNAAPETPDLIPKPQGMFDIIKDKFKGKK